MSRFAINKSCDVCGKNEVGLVELTVGKTKHHLCYQCMLVLCNDLDNFKRMNYNADEIKSGISREKNIVNAISK